MERILIGIIQILTLFGEFARDPNFEKLKKSQCRTCVNCEESRTDRTGWTGRMHTKH